MEVHALDYVVCVILLSISLGVGVFYAYKDRNKLSLFRYHRGDAKLKALPVAISLIVTRESSVFFLGYPAEIYAYGIPYLLSSVAKSFGYLSIVYVVIPLFYPMGITSVYEYLVKRYDSALIGRICAVIEVLVDALYSAIILFGTSVAIYAVTSIDVWILVIGLAAVTVIYTALGGIKAVVFADVIQCCIMMVAVVAVLVYGTITVGGIGHVVRLNAPSGRMKMFDFDPDPIVRNSFWAVMIGNISSVFVRELGSQTAVQRLNSTRSFQEARKVMFIFLPCICIIEVLVMFQGLVAFAYFNSKGCDPFASGQISNLNQIIPVTVAHMFSDIPGALGVYVAALCSASLSTISSMFCSMSAASTVELQKTIFKSSSQRKVTIISKILVVIITIISVVFALIIGQVKGPLTQIASTIMASVFGPIAGIFALAIFSKTSSLKGVIVGAAVGLAFGSWISIGSNFLMRSRPTQPLPFDPNYNCPLSQIDIVTNMNITINIKNATHKTVHNTGNIILQNMKNESTAMSPMQPSAKQRVKGLNRLYSISFNYFGILVASVTIATGLIASRIFKRDNSIDIPENLTMSFSAVMFTCLCPFLNRTTRGGRGNSLMEEQAKHQGSHCTSTV